MRAFVCVVAFAASALVAAPSAQAEAQSGAIDWQRRVIRCKGQAAPDVNAANVAQARIGAERAAKADAMRNILETLKGVQVTGAKTGADALTDPGVSSRVQGTLRHFNVVDTRYFSDGGVEVDVEMPLDGLIDALVPPANAPRKAAADKAASTGLVVDARGVKARPALAPRVLDEKGDEVYGPASVDREKARNGLAAFASDVDAAKTDARVAGSPLVIKAIALAQGSVSDVVISNEDAAKARQARLSEGNVVFVLD